MLPLVLIFIMVKDIINSVITDEMTVGQGRWLLCICWMLTVNKFTILLTG